MPKIGEPLGKILDVAEEKDADITKDLLEISRTEKAVLLAFIAPYVGMRVSPTRILTAELGMSEEFGVETVINEIKRKTEAETLHLLINSPGGFVASSYKVARALRKNFKKITVFVPHIAASGGTLVALAGNEIVMGIMSHLSPMDPSGQFGKSSVSAKSIVDGFDMVTTYFKKLSVADAPYTYKVLADKYDAQTLDQAISALTLQQDYICEILNGSGCKDKKAEKIAETFVRGFRSHSEVINSDKAKKIGLNIATDEKYPKEWNTMRSWLGMYLLKSADKHIIRYLISQDLIKTKPSSKIKAKPKVPEST
jgi:hypothetical protein